MCTDPGRLSFAPVLLYDTLSFAQLLAEWSNRLVGVYHGRRVNSTFRANDQATLNDFSHSTHFSHMSEPILPISHL